MGTPKSECFLGERKHSEALSFLSKAKKRLAELRADEVVGSSLTIILRLDRTIVRYASMRTVQIKYILQNCCSEKSILLTIGTDRSVPYGSISYYIAED